MELKIPPPLQAFIFAGLIWGVSVLDPSELIDPGIRTTSAIVVLLLGLSINFSGIWVFRVAKTTVSPLKPESASKLVIGGIYHFTRNPMYLGLLLIVSSWAIWLGSLYNIASELLFVWYITTFQIELEEKALEALFPREYERYKSEV